MSRGRARRRNRRPKRAATTGAAKPRGRDSLARFAAIVGVVSALLAVPIAVFDLHKRVFPDPKPISPSVEIVVDRSAAMDESWAGKTTRFQAAERTVKDVVRQNKGHNLALRGFGGECGQESERLVDFGTDNSERFDEALQSTQPAGRADVVQAVADAIDDFGDRERFPATVEKTIVIVTRGHNCPGEAEKGLRERLAVAGNQTNIRLDFRFVGVGVPSDEQAELVEIASDFGQGPPEFVEDEERLAATLKTVVADEPMLAAMGTVREHVDASISDLNGFADAAFDDPDADLASESLKNARVEIDRTAEDFDRLATQHSRSDFRQLYRYAARNRQNQQRSLELAKRYLHLASRSPGERAKEVETAVREWNLLVDAYNDNNSAMDEIMEALRQ